MFNKIKELFEKHPEEDEVIVSDENDKQIFEKIY